MNRSARNDRNKHEHPPHVKRLVAAFFVTLAPAIIAACGAAIADSNSDAPPEPSRTPDSHEIVYANPFGVHAGLEYGKAVAQSREAAWYAEATRQIEAARAAAAARIQPPRGTRGGGGGSGACTPEGIAQAESGGSYTAENPTSTASGKYQFLDTTWNGYGGYSHAADAPPEVQEAKFAETWAGGAGASHWAASVC